MFTAIDTRWAKSGTFGILYLSAPRAIRSMEGTRDVERVRTASSQLAAHVILRASLGFATSLTLFLKK
jgi:hypothetical protein